MKIIILNRMIPYVISIARPCYKRPELDQSFGSISEEELENFILTNVSEFILDRLPLEDINYIKDITQFWDDYYSEYYMGNEPYSVMIFKDNEWQNATPSDDEIFEYIKNNENKLKNGDIINTIIDIEDYINKNIMDAMSPIDKIYYNSFNEHNKILYILEKIINKALSTNDKHLISSFINHINMLIKEKNQEINELREEAEKTDNFEKLNKAIDLVTMLFEYKLRLIVAK